MKIIVNILVLLLMLIAVNRSNSIATPRTYQEIIKSNEIRLCHVPWISDKKENVGNGPNFELAKYFAEYLNVKPKLVQMLWKNLLSNKNGKILKKETYSPFLFEKQQCDIYVANIGKYKWCENKIDIVSFISSRALIVVRKQNEGEIVSIKKLGGKKTQVIASTSFALELKQLNKTTLKNNPIKLKVVEEGNSLKELLNGNIDFTVYDIQLALYLVKKMPNRIAMAFPIGKGFDTGWGVPKKRAKLKQKIVEFFGYLKNSNKSPLNKIFMKLYGITRQEYDDLFYSVLTNNDKKNSIEINMVINPTNWLFRGERIEDLD